MESSAFQTKSLRQPTPDDLLEEELMRDYLKQLQEEYLNNCYLHGTKPLANIEAELEYPQEYRSVISPSNKDG